MSLRTITPETAYTLMLWITYLAPGLTTFALLQANTRLRSQIESLQGRHIRADLARTVVQSGWNLSELRAVGLSLWEKAGATLTSTETVLFDLLGVAGTPEFKELTALIK